MLPKFSRLDPGNTNNTDRNDVNKRKTHTHTHTHTCTTHPHTHTHTHTPEKTETFRERQHWKGLVSMKVSDTHPFLKQPHLFYQPLHVYDPTPFFSKISKSHSPL